MKKSDDVYQSRAVRRERWYATHPGPLSLAELEQEVEAFNKEVYAERRETGAKLASTYTAIEAVGWRIRLSVVVEFPREKKS